MRRLVEYPYATADDATALEQGRRNLELWCDRHDARQSTKPATLTSLFPGVWTGGRKPPEYAMSLALMDHCSLWNVGGFRPAVLVTEPYRSEPFNELERSFMQALTLILDAVVVVKPNVTSWHLPPSTSHVEIWRGDVLRMINLYE